MSCQRWLGALCVLGRLLPDWALLCIGTLLTVPMLLLLLLLAGG